MEAVIWRWRNETVVGRVSRSTSRRTLFGTAGLFFGLVFFPASPVVFGQEGTAPPPQVAISPPRFELEIGPRPSTEAIRVSNLGDEAIEIEVTVANWDLDESNSVRVVEPTEQSLDQWMIINPLKFSVPPRKTQNVRFSIRPRVAPEPGEHRAMIFLDQVLPEGGSKKGIRMRFQYGVAVYGQVGQKVLKGELHGVEVGIEKGHVVGAFDISCTGNAHVRLDGQYAIWPAAVYPGKDATGVIASKAETPEGLLHFGRLPSLPVLPGCRRRLAFDLDLPLEPGDYIVDINGELAGKPLNQFLPLSVPVFSPPEGGGEISEETGVPKHTAPTPDDRVSR